MQLQMVAHVPVINEIRRNSNRIAKFRDPLVALYNNAGMVPQNFPVNKSALAVHTIPQLNALIAFYNLNAPQGLNARGRLTLVAEHIGL